VFLGGGPGLSSRPFAEATQATIDSEVARLLREAEESAVTLIRAHRAELSQLVDLLLEKETVDGQAVYQIAGKPVPGHRPQELAIAPHARSMATTAAGNGSDPALRTDPHHRPRPAPRPPGQHETPDPARHVRPAA
jgi:cell division protease FtsH